MVIVATETGMPHRHNEGETLLHPFGTGGQQTYSQEEKT
jgi:hypothetical protein